MCPRPAIYYLLSTIYYLVHSYDISGLTCEHSPARHQSAVLRTLTGGWSPGNLAANLTADLTGPPQPHAGLLTGHLTTWPSLAAGLGACLCVVFSLSRLHLSPDCGGAAAGAPEQPLATHKFESCGGWCVSAAGRMRTLNYGTRCWRPHHASLYLLHNTGDTCWLP